MDFAKEGAAVFAKIAIGTPGMLGRAARSMRGPGIGGLLGAGLTALELGTGWANPDMTPETKAQLGLVNVGLGAALGSRAGRQALVMKQSPVAKTWWNPFSGKQTVPVMLDGSVQQMPILAHRPAPGRALMLATGAGALPKALNYADAGYKSIKGILPHADQLGANLEKMTRDPAGDLQKKVVGPSIDRLRTEVVEPATSRTMGAISDQAKKYAPTFFQSLGINLASALGGGYLGGRAGRFAGSLVAADDEKLPYEKRRSRERIRNLLELAGVPLGGAGAMLAAYRYQPQLAAALNSMIPADKVP